MGLSIPLSRRVDAVRSTVEAVSRIRGTERRRHDNLVAVLHQTNEEIADFEKAIELCRACIEEQVSAKEHIEKLATSLLNTVMQGVWREESGFGVKPEYEFFLEPNINGEGATVGLKPRILKNGISDDPKNYGGGVQNLVSFAIRLSYLLLNPDLSQVLILDEPMTNLAPAAWKYVVKFLEDLQEDFDLQVIAITHSGASFPTEWRVTRSGDTSKVSQVVDGVLVK